MASVSRLACSMIDTGLLAVCATAATASTVSFPIDARKHVTKSCAVASDTVGTLLSSRFTKSRVDEPPLRLDWSFPRFSSSFAMPLRDTASPPKRHRLQCIHLKMSSLPLVFLLSITSLSSWLPSLVVKLLMRGGLRPTFELWSRSSCSNSSSRASLRFAMSSTCSRRACTCSHSNRSHLWFSFNMWNSSTIRNCEIFGSGSSTLRISARAISTSRSSLPSIKARRNPILVLTSSANSQAKCDLPAPGGEHSNSTQGSGACISSFTWSL
mmetsp:Transcript_63797/g.93409  ORF Transcript_63797/g.93409 Transcript_63797/m.93409 type:complete len:269 (-) Transcript_63797:1152-1958(-)